MNCYGLNPEQLRTLCEDYRKGTGYSILARALKLDPAIVREILVDQGIQIRGAGSPLKAMIDQERLRELHAKGLSTLALAKHLNSTRTVIRHRLKMLGLRPLTGTEANLARMKALSIEERMALTEAAHQATRGRKAPQRRMIAAALANEKACRQSENERKVQARLKALGLVLRPQAAVFKYNIDLAHMPGRVAIEVHNTWHTTPSKALADASKLYHLNSCGWMTVYIDPDAPESGLYESIAALCRFREAWLASHHPEETQHIGNGGGSQPDK